MSSQDDKLREVPDCYQCMLRPARIKYDGKTEVMVRLNYRKIDEPTRDRLNVEPLII